MRNWWKKLGLGRWWTGEDGNATIEFVLLFPAFMTFFLMSFETGMVLIRGVMLDRATDIAMRELRLGTLSPMTKDGLKAEICRNSVLIPNCSQSLLVELRPVSTTTWNLPSGSATCVDRTAKVQPVLDFVAGSSNELMMVRACAVFDPFFPTTGLAAPVKLDQSGAYALVSTSAFVNEP